MTDFEKICNFDVLYRSHIKAKKRRNHKRDVMVFELDLAHQLTILQETLMTGTYRMSGYRHFQVKEPKTRDIHEISHVDKVVMHALCDEILKPHLTPHFIYDNVACQKGKGTHFAMRRLTKFLLEGFSFHHQNFYVLKCDISQYFASINHDVLKQQLVKRIPDLQVLKLLYHLIDSYCAKGYKGKRVGLPLGNQTSQWFALFYMSGFDHFVKEQLKVSSYLRYMDDFLLIHKINLILCLLFLDNSNFFVFSSGYFIGSIPVFSYVALAFILFCGTSHTNILQNLV